MHKDTKFHYARVLLHPTPSGAPSRREPFDISVVIYEYNNTALWPSGKAKVCNTSIPGSIPGGASKQKSTARAVLFCLERCVPQAERDVHFVRDVSFGSDVRFAREDAEHITSLCDQREQNITVR